MILPLAPFPSINQILFSGSRVKTPWNAFGKQVAYFSRGGVALAAVLRRLQKELKRKQIVVYIPDYFCNQSLVWLRNEKCNIKFYPIDLGFNPDWENVENIAKEDAPPDLFIIVHYFGFCNDVEQAGIFCEKYGAKLLEDAAHVLRPTGLIGKRGWLSLFSPHKLLPLPPLGIITYKESENDVHWDLTSESFCRANDFFWLAKRLTQSFLTKVQINYKTGSSLPDFDDNGQSGINDLSGKGKEKASIVAIKWLYGLLCNLDKFALCRQVNYRIFEELFSKFPDINPGFGCKDSDTVPYLFVFRANETVTRKIFSELRSRMIPVQTWPDMPPEVLSNVRFHSKALKLRKTVLALPIHQNLTNNQILYMKNVLNDLLMSMSNNINKFNVDIKKIDKNARDLTIVEKSDQLPGLIQIDKKQWNDLLQSCNRTNLMQNWEYGEAKRSSLCWKPKRFALQDEKGNTFGIVQVLMVSLPL
ncbi:MAG: DegT/DnrJ/EryC1/StrS family aminotransferase, partial [Candidatus Anammoxibacter sp.]